MENNPQTAVPTAQQAGKTATNQFERIIATLKRDRDSIIDDLNGHIRKVMNENHDLKLRIQANNAKIHDLNMNKELIYKSFRTAIMRHKDNSLDYYSENCNVVGKMLHRFFDAHPEIREIWNDEKDFLWHQVQEGGVQ